MAPPTRKVILASMGKAYETFAHELAKGFLEDPKSSESTQIMIEAMALGLCRYAATTNIGPAMVQTYIYELQDYLNSAVEQTKESKK